MKKKTSLIPQHFRMQAVKNFALSIARWKMESHAVPLHGQSPKTVGRKRSSLTWTRLSVLATFCCPPIA